MTRFQVTIVGEKNGITKSVVVSKEILRDAVEAAVLSFINAEADVEFPKLTQEDLDLLEELS